MAPRHAASGASAPRATAPHATQPNTIERLVGRTAAACAHPHSAWRTSRRSFRVMLVAGYFLLGFTTAFAALLLS
jgi:hypothetical protein